MAILKMKVIPTMDCNYPWNVQKWHSYDGGKTFVYAGYGRFCKSIEEADEYIRSSFEEQKEARAV